MLSKKRREELGLKIGEVIGEILCYGLIFGMFYLHRKMENFDVCEYTYPKTKK